MVDEIGPRFEELFGRSLRPLTPPQVLQLLKSGHQDLLMILYWDEQMPEHQLVIHDLRPDQRVVFYNPYRTADHPVGTELSNPIRRVEEGHLESVSFDVFRTFFTERKAVCYDTSQA